MAPRIYLDYNATTPVDPAVLEAMLPFFSGEFGNAASIHTTGQKARAAVETAREQVAALINANPQEIVFTSGGTESDNHALFGMFDPTNYAEANLISTVIEHEAVLNTCSGASRTRRHRRLSHRQSRRHRSIRNICATLRDNLPDTNLISVMHANNELGTVQPLEEIGTHRGRGRRLSPYRRRPIRRQNTDRRKHFAS